MEPVTSTVVSGAAPAARPILQVTNLEVGYGKLAEVVRGVSLTVPAGGVVTLLGPNGAGKTTIMRALAGLLDFHDGELRRGSVLVDGVDLTKASAAERVRAGIALVPEGRMVFATLTVDENLRAGAYTVGIRGAALRRALEGAYEQFPPLAARRNQAAGYLSGGEQQMLAVGRALMAQPRLLLLDEPSLGLAPMVVQEIGRVIRRVNEAGTAVLLVEQNALLALDIASYGYVLETGRVVLDGPAERLAANDDIREFYLGVHTTGDHHSFREVKHYRRRKRWLS